MEAGCRTPNHPPASAGGNPLTTAMRPLTDREKRTVRFAALFVGAYLILFFGLQGWKYGERRRAEYERLLRDATAFRQRLEVYDDKALNALALMEQFRMDPARLSRATIVSEATAAIHKAAMQGGLQLGPIRESPARAAARELTAIQLEGTGPVPAVLGFIQSIGQLGYPLVADSLQLMPEASQPGQLKVNVTLVILDFDQWKAAPPRTGTGVGVSANANANPPAHARAL